MFCIFALQIEQDFRLLFCEVTGSKFLERWLTNLKAKVVKESHGLVPTSELLALMCNAESGWDSDLSTILLLLHLLPPSAQGRKRPGKMSASQAVNNLIKFPKAGTSVQQHLDNITRSSQPYHLTQGSTRSSIHTFIVFEKHALPLQQVCNFMDLIFKNGGNVQPQEEHVGEEVATSRLPYSQRVTTADSSNLPNRTPSRDQTRDLSGNV
ncbi:uncharacterized protein LOC120736891 [Simochromis diagramma]|uniref:uncharacterized protein LOC120736891 n=1 Tax=Simochromis diagramma TaxID=43689 RepID=UPI001A7E5107|nr:uncharacterized protein LOC120736891 [Simochromis diagramma]